MPTFRVLSAPERERVAPHRPRLVGRSRQRSRPHWWTRERVIAGLRLFYRETGAVPVDGDAYHEMTKCEERAQVRRYPSAYAVRKHFNSMRAAWEAAGLPMDRRHEDWTELEEWYIREAAGILTREEIGRDLRRSPDAVHRRLYDLGLNTRECHGWSQARVCAATGLSIDRLHYYMLHKLIDWQVGTTNYYFDPADLVVIEEIDWERADPELVRAARAGLYGRIARTMERRLRWPR